MVQPPKAAAFSTGGLGSNGPNNRATSSSPHHGGHRTPGPLSADTGRSFCVGPVGAQPCVIGGCGPFGVLLPFPHARLCRKKEEPVQVLDSQWLTEGNPPLLLASAPHSGETCLPRGHLPGHQGEQRAAQSLKDALHSPCTLTLPPYWAVPEQPQSLKGGEYTTSSHITVPNIISPTYPPCRLSKVGHGHGL